MTLKPIIGKWQLVFSSTKDYQSFQRGWHIATWGIVKIVQMPDQGATIGPRDYKGFLLRFFYFTPIDRA